MNYYVHFFCCQLEEMENERIEELGTSLSAKPGQDSHLGGSVRHNSTKSLRPSNTLASSSLTDLRNQSPMEDEELGKLAACRNLCLHIGKEKDTLRA